MLVGRSFEDGLKIVKARGEAMQAAADAQPSGMVSVIGLDAEKTTALCERATAEVRVSVCCCALMHVTSPFISLYAAIPSPPPLAAQYAAAELGCPRGL